MTTRITLTMVLLFTMQQLFAYDTSKPVIDTLALEKPEALPKIEPKKKLKPYLVTADGYSLQVLKTRDRKKAFNTKGALLQQLPGTKVYLTYKAPYFRLRVGRFFSRQEAIRFQKKFLRNRSKVYTVKEKIVYMWYPPGE